ncbi:hypothetical protein KI688_007310 [Linnemannia hyalina]|uniref:Uncharacterized protein n=1 Tax=Linnemannia hyalina TaxID=64524 RepID=A0A9P8BPX0_9FUNG|nr:hypothetical protein KI688_007310 [Linnemannia hyalina]
MNVINNSSPSFHNCRSYNTTYRSRRQSRNVVLKYKCRQRLCLKIFIRRMSNPNNDYSISTLKTMNSKRRSDAIANTLENLEMLGAENVASPTTQLTKDKAKGKKDKDEGEAIAMENVEFT